MLMFVMRWAYGEFLLRMRPRATIINAGSGTGGEYPRVTLISSRSERSMRDVIAVLTLATFALPQLHASSEIAAVLEYSPVTGSVLEDAVDRTESWQLEVAL